MFEIPLIPYAMILTVMGLSSIYYISLVILRQLQLLKLPIDTSMKHFRLTLFYLAIAVLAGNLFPLFIDIFAIFNPMGRPPFIKLISFIYALSIHSTLTVASYFIWRLYQLAAQVDETNLRSEHILINEDPEELEELNTKG